MRVNISCPRRGAFPAPVHLSAQKETKTRFTSASKMRHIPKAMKKPDLPLLADTLFLFFAAGLLSLCLFRFYIPLAPSLAAAAGCGLAAATLYFMLSRPRRLKKRGNAARQKEIEKLAFHLAMEAPERSAALLAEGINAARREEGPESPPAKAEGDIVISGEKRGYLKFRFEKVTADELSPYVRADGAEKAVFAGDFTEEAKKLADAFGLRLIGAEEVYDLLSAGGKLPEKLIAPPEQRGGAKEKLKPRIRRSAWKGYLLSGSALLIFSLFTIFPLYYIISGSVLLAISVFVRFFGKKE